MAAGATPLMHDLKKFADTGLQLRLPVDLVPANQYSRLSNCIPVIEGELRTREGLTLIENVYADAAIASLERPNNAATTLTIANTIYPHGYIAGSTAIITVFTTSPDAISVVTPGSYAVSISSVSSSTQFVFTPGIPGTFDPSELVIAVLAKSAGSGPVTTLPDVAIQTIYTLNQTLPQLAGDRLVSFVGRLFQASLPAGSDFAELVLPSLSGRPPSVPNGFSGNPLSIISFRFSLASQSWAIIADTNLMAKYRASGIASSPFLFFRLGNPTPTEPAVASADGAGNLDSSGGTDYDWRYTYFDGYTQTEGNPSPGTDSGTIEVLNSTTHTTPDTTLTAGLGLPIVNGAFTGVTNVSGTGDVTVPPSDPLTRHYVSCVWDGFPNPSATSFVTTLVVDWLLTITDPNTSAFRSIAASLQVSTNNGASYTAFDDLSTSTGGKTSTTTLPLGVDMTQIKFRVIAGGYVTPSGSSVTVHCVITNIEIDANLSPTTGAISCVNQQALVCCADPGNLNDGRVTAIRLYRRGGSLPDAYRLVGTFNLSGLTVGGCGAGFFEITDNVSDTTLSTQPIMELDNDPPVTSVSTTNQPLSFIWGPVGLEARVLGCGDPNRPESIYFSKPGNPDAWPPQNHIEVSDPGTPIIAGCVFNNRTFAFSRERIYELIEGYVPGVTFTPFVTPSAHGLFSPWAFAVGPSIYFVAKDGIYETTGGQEVSIVENDIKPLFPTYDTPGQDVNGYEAVDYTQPNAMRLRYHNDELWFLYIGATTGTRQVLVYDIIKHRWRSSPYTVGMSEMYSELATTSSLLLGSNGGALFSNSGDFDPSQLDVIENVQISRLTTGVVTLAAGTYYARVSRFTSAGEVALSNQSDPITVDGTHGIQAVIPDGPSDTTKWRVYYGTTSGVPNQYKEYTEADLVLSRTVSISTAGTAGSPASSNPDDRIFATLRTGAHDQGQPLNRKQYDNVIFDLDPGLSTISITPIINGETQTNAAITVTGSGRQQVPLDLSDYFAFNTEYEISWHKDVIADLPGGTPFPILFQYDTLHYLEPVGLKHFALQPSSSGFPGYMHARDAYVAIRSTADVTLTLKLDGGLDAAHIQTYTIPSTSGERQRVYIQFASNKAKQYELALDSTQEFRVYPSDFEWRVKPWLGLLGYAVQREFTEAVG